MKMLSAIRMLVAGLMLATTSANAATLNQLFLNDFATNGIYLWSSNPSNMTFGGASFGVGMSGWTQVSNTGAQLVMSGPTVAPFTGLFNVTMNYTSAPFNMEWAEVFFSSGTPTLRGAGTLTYNGSGWGSSNAFTHLADIPMGGAPVPVPAALWLLGSALGALGVLKRRSV
jgi:hypothetical protein